MRDGPLGAAGFNNEFGRPCLAGYFRTFELETAKPGMRHGYDKPIMLAGGVANVRPMLVKKNKLAPGDQVIVLGGPAMLIGLGGGAASSMAAGASSEALDFASVQRDNPEMQRRCQEVIDACCAFGDTSPIVAIHDVGAGGLSNAIPELLHDSGVGGDIDLDAVPLDDPQLSPMQIWCNESQERYVLGVKPADLDRFRALCERERCPFAVVGTATEEQRLRVRSKRDPRVIDMELATLLGKPPRMQRDATRIEPQLDIIPDLTGIGLHEAIERVLRMPAVADKAFLIHIGDRSVGGLCARDQLVGPWQVPVADCALTLADFQGYRSPAVGQLDGRDRPRRRGRGAVRRRASRFGATVPRARDVHSSRQGLAVDAHAMARCRPRTAHHRSGVADRQRVRARGGRAWCADATAPDGRGRYGTVAHRPWRRP